jgi:hypothetical protein
MAEIKHSFQAGKMNKDFDERLVPNGEYRDALNIEVRTSGDSDVGTAQNLYGNIERLTYNSVYPINLTESFHDQENGVKIKSTTVGCIADERTNKAYFFVAAPPVGEVVHANIGGNIKVFKDTILQYDNTLNVINPVVNDIFEVYYPSVKIDNDTEIGNSTGFTTMTIPSAQAGSLDHIRPGMSMSAKTNADVSLTAGAVGNLGYEPVVKSINYSTRVITFDRTIYTNLATATYYVFKSNEHVLDFYRGSGDVKKNVTGINIIDNMLFWTDHYSEPKKINIDRCIAGTTGFDKHTNLMITNPNSSSGALTNVGNLDSDNSGHLKKEHITVIRKSPRVAPKLQMASTMRGNVETTAVCIQSFTTADSSVMMTEGDVKSNVEINGADYYVGDVLIFESSLDVTNPVSVRFVVNSVDDNLYELTLISADSDVTSGHEDWDVKLEQIKPLFELQFGRFAYRYKYEDGEYSTFSPWSELAFLPGEFDYIPKKGYNLGMVNTLRDLKITDFIVSDKLRPDDIVSVDILYKDTVSPNIRVVKTVKRGSDPEWDETTGADSGVLNITSEMIHSTLPSSQLLRAWDNVPRTARAQEVTGNRVVYGNYLQNYDIKAKITIEPELITASHTSGSGFGKQVYSDLKGKKSIKSIRKYKIGVVLGDKYGRETPVVGIGGMTFDDKVIPSDVENKKENAHKVSKLAAQLNWGTDSISTVPDSWMDYYKYYVKETTNEYYNLVMDRWYDAEDGNAWLSFQSADRNKIDESTYLILKNEHGTQQPVTEEARYKVIAIENEAPDFIKTTEKILGTQPLENGENYLHLVDSMIVTQPDLISTQYNSTFGNIEFKGIGYARLRGVYSSSIIYSKWVKISRMNDENASISLVEPFGETANLYAAFGLADNATNVEVSIEVMDAVVENRPEFDGRFFVKVYRDGVLSKNVLLATDANVNYNIVGSHSFAYLNNSWTHQYDTDGYTWVGYGHFSSSTISQFGTACGSPFSAAGAIRQNTKKFWEDWGGQGHNDVFWFIDEIDIYNDKGFEEDPPGLLNTTGVGPSWIFFSNRNEHDFGTGAQLEFKTKMCTVGTFFKFADDPNDVVYKVKSSNDGGWGFNFSQWAFNGGGSCGDPNGLDGEDHRTTFKTEFVRADDETKGLDATAFDPRQTLKQDGKNSASIHILEVSYDLPENIKLSQGNAIWETEPKEDVGLDLYYEATSAIPLILSDSNSSSFAPVNSTVKCIRETGNLDTTGAFVSSIENDIVEVKVGSALTKTIIKGDRLRFTRSDDMVTESKVLDYWHATDYKPSQQSTHDNVTFTNNNNTLQNVVVAAGSPLMLASSSIVEVISKSPNVTIPIGTYVNSSSLGASAGSQSIALSNQVTTHDGNAEVTSVIFKEVTGRYRLDSNVYKYRTELPWFNCYSFGNGLESDRIRDDFNAPTIDNGVKVSTILEDYREERRGSGMIYSGIYNSTSGINNLNEFNMAESITKDLNPSYGTLQALKTRDTNVVAFCEDKVFKILANKDALFNSDGSKNLTASNRVLGDASGFAGDFGISSNPESLAVDGYRMYFTDKQRNKVLRLSQDGLTPISDVGMTTWFRDHFKPTQQLLGSFDEIKGEYNLTLKHTPDYMTWRRKFPELVTNDNDDITISFNEKSKGWSSFKSFIPQTGLSINDEYLTSVDGRIWSHHDETAANNANKFYGTQYNSSISVLFNDSPGDVKSFTTVNYEGTQARVTQNTSDGHYYNLTAKEGWYVDSFKTDQQDGLVNEFIDKEGKWFNYVVGEDTTLANIDTSEFSVQGLGEASAVSGYTLGHYTLTIIEGGD